MRRPPGFHRSVPSCKAENLKMPPPSLIGSARGPHLFGRTKSMPSEWPPPPPWEATAITRDPTWGGRHIHHHAWGRMSPQWPCGLEQGTVPCMAPSRPQMHAPARRSTPHATRHTVAKDPAKLMECTPPPLTGSPCVDMKGGGEEPIARRTVVEAVAAISMWRHRYFSDPNGRLSHPLTDPLKLTR